MNVAEYIFNFLAEKGVEDAFMISGGQAMFLVDALYKNKKIRTICTHHEQSIGMSADAYGRLTGKMSIALVTAGPGAVNIINGVVGGWTDSSPMIIISGQSGLSYVEYQNKTKIRQYGIQGINIKPLVEKVTKFFVTVDDVYKIKYYMQKAYHLATTERPGPVWIDVPLDVQKMEVPEGLLEEYTPPKDEKDYEKIRSQVKIVTQLLMSAKRPLIIAGQGISSANARDELHHLCSTYNVPVITSRLGIDLIESNNPLYVGRPGTYGERSANFAVQNSDLIIAIGTRLATAMVGHDPKDWGRNAKIVAVDIDPEELNKPGVNIDVKILSDCKYFLIELINHIKDEITTHEIIPDYQLWAERCQEWKKKYTVVLEEYKAPISPINSYYFTSQLSKLSHPDDYIVVDTGSCFHVACQTWVIKKGQKFLTTGGLSSMGYWVAGIGACVANKKKNTIVITGDGSLQMNIQEFATIKHNKLPIKVFIFNNNGYLLIRHTQKNFMDGRLFGEGPETGVWCPDSLEIAKAYGIKGIRIDSTKDMDKQIKEVLDYDGPVICDIITPEWQLIMPRTASDKLKDGTLVQKAYEDMYPFLDPEQLKKEMNAIEMRK